MEQPTSVSPVVVELTEESLTKLLENTWLPCKAKLTLTSEEFTKLINNIYGTQGV